MSNTVLTKNESQIVAKLVTFLRDKSRTRLVDRLCRVWNYAIIGSISRQSFFAPDGVLREAVFRAIKLACADLDADSVLEFSILLEVNGELTRNKSLGMLSCLATNLNDLP